VRSIQTKLTITILLIFSLALGALGGLNYWKARQIVNEDITKNMVDQAASAARDIGDWLEARRAEMTVISVAPVVVSGNKADIFPFLAAVGNVNKAYNSISYASPDGRYINSRGPTGSIIEREYFKKAMRGEASFSDPLVNKSTGQLVAVVAVPVKGADGKVNGAQYGAIDMAGLTKKVLDVKVGKSGYAFVVQSDGLQIIHPDKEAAMKRNALKDADADPGQKAVTERMVKGEQGIATFPTREGDKYYAFAPIPGTGWSLAVTVPVAEVTGAVQTLTTISLVTIVVVLVIAGLFIAWMARRIARPIQVLEEAAAAIAAGDISASRMNVSSNDEIGRLGRSFEAMTAHLRSLVNQILGVTERVAASAEELTANAEQSAQAANQVATSISQTAQGAEKQSMAVDGALSRVKDMAAAAEAGAESTNRAVDISKQAVEAAAKGNTAVETAVDQMNHIRATVDDSAKVVAELGEKSREIGNIVDAISNIAGQTNLLALNAAIEAARAGEAGRGFAVVAEEVRKLAEESQEAAKQIADLIADIRGKTEMAVTAMNQGTAEVHKGTEVVNNAGAAFRDIMSHVQKVAEIASGAACGLAELATGSGQVLAAVGEVETISRDIASQAQNISAATEEQSASMEEIASSSEALAKLAEELQTAVRQFRL
jgi:methyl-accepting chemotaxis protein